MRSLFLILLLANLLFFAAQFTAVRALVAGSGVAPRASQMNAEKLRIVRDTSSQPMPPAHTPAPPG